MRLSRRDVLRASGTAGAIGVAGCAARRGESGFGEDFPDPGVNTTALGETPYGGLREPLWLADGWREYRFEWTTPDLSTDTLYVALGHAVVWEGDATHYVDDITVEFEEQ